MTEQEIEDALAALGLELQRLSVQQPIRILVVERKILMCCLWTSPIQLHHQPISSCKAQLVSKHAIKRSSSWIGIFQIVKRSNSIRLR